MAPQGYASPAAAEAAFYDAFERADLEGMMRVWAPEEDVECIHSHGPRLRGREAVRRSWEAILQGGAGARFTLSERRVLPGDTLVLHTLTETLQLREGLQARVLATNAYRRGAQGWHMVLHHASPPAPPARAPTPPRAVH